MWGKCVQFKVVYILDIERILGQCSAKIVIGDVDEKAGMGVVEDITSAGGYAHF